MDEMEKTMTGLTVGLAITGSFCTFSRLLEEVKVLKELGAEIIPIFSLITSLFFFFISSSLHFFQVFSKIVFHHK